MATVKKNSVKRPVLNIIINGRDFNGEFINEKLKATSTANMWVKIRQIRNEITEGKRPLELTITVKNIKTEKIFTKLTFVKGKNGKILMPFLRGWSLRKKAVKAENITEVTPTVTETAEVKAE